MEKKEINTLNLHRVSVRKTLSTKSLITKLEPSLGDRLEDMGSKVPVNVRRHSVIKKWIR